jgi:SAM-dependent methyltransferase
MKNLLLDYYQRFGFNPVPIDVENQEVWVAHFEKRINLYQSHLGIPFSFLRDRDVLEIGCNSGENALVLASAGARLTLVEPNEQVVPRIRHLFQTFGLEHHIDELITRDVQNFETDRLFDLVIAEGFLFTLPDRDRILAQICRFIRPGGLWIVSFIDRYGSLVEMTKRMMVWAAMRAEGNEDIHSRASLEIAERFFLEDYKKLNASRSFDVWWKDVLVNPLMRSESFWSYLEIMGVISGEGGEFHSTSPGWSRAHHFSWYKNVPDKESRDREILKQWTRHLPYFITGWAIEDTTEGKDPAILLEIQRLVDLISDATGRLDQNVEEITYPVAFSNYLEQMRDHRATRLNTEWKKIFEKINQKTPSALSLTYDQSPYLRSIWGVPYHYLCFLKSL